MPYKMPIEDAQLVIRYVLEYLSKHKNSFAENDICFHGGEPSLLPVEYLESLWGQIRDSGMDIAISMQSNLYDLPDRLLQAIKKYDVRMSTSVDGPQGIHDRSRVDKSGEGTFLRVMKNIARCRENGVRMGLICTLNKFNCKSPKELYHFFKELGVPYKLNWVHKIGNGVNPLIHLSSSEVSNVLIQMLDSFLEDTSPTVFDDTSTEFMTGIMSGKMVSCSMMGHCQKEFVCIESNGDVYPCDAFSYLPNAHKYCFGNIMSEGASVFESDCRCALQLRDVSRVPKCSGCENASICNGGCLLDAEDGDYISGQSIFCDVYKRVFSHCREIKTLMANS